MLLTVFTPTYNRRELLSRVYESLKNQTNKDFVWLIVDDGSTDDTRSIVDSFISEGMLDIRYHFRENGGKMRAHNTGVCCCDTELFVCLDSDDILSPESVDHIIKCWTKGDNFGLSGIVAYKGELDENGNLREFLGKTFPQSILDNGCSPLRGIYRSGFQGETTLVYRTEVLKKYLFPEIDGEKYVPEDYIYDKIDNDYALKVLPEILTVCEIVEGGYTDSAARLRRENPTGWFLYYEQRMKNEPWSLLKIKYISHYMRFARVLGKRLELDMVSFLVGLPGALALRILGKT